MAIGDFPEKKIYNLGGYTSFSFALVQNIASFPMVANGVTQGGVTFAAGSWLNGYATPGSLALNQEPQTDENGTHYLLSIAAFVPGDKPELSSLFEQMRHQRFLVLLQDSGGIMRLAGSPVAPLDFSSAYASGAQRADQKGYNIKFSGLSRFMAPVYTG